MPGKSQTTEIIDRLKNLPGRNIRIEQIVGCMQDVGYPALLLTLALLCIAIPVPKVPPFNLVFALPFLFFGWQMLRGETIPALPEFICKKTVSKERLKKSAEKINRALGKAETIARSTLPKVTNFRYINRIIGAGVIVMTLSILLPLPFTSSIPSFFIAVTALGRIYNDGRLILAGLTGGCLWVYVLFSTLGEVIEETFEFLLWLRP